MAAVASHSNGSSIQPWRLLGLPSINRMEENMLIVRSLNKTGQKESEFELAAIFWDVRAFSQPL